MSLSARLFIGLVALLITSSVVAAQSTAEVASSGETIVSTTTGKLSVQAMIKTHEMQIGKPSDVRPAEGESSCTYSKYPCSIVDRLGITVNGRSLFVPRSAFCDLADLTRAEIKVSDSQAVLVLHGGDASESYIVRITFDSAGVIRRTFSSATSPALLLQETDYHTQVLGD